MVHHTAPESHDTAKSSAFMARAKHLSRYLAKHTRRKSSFFMGAMLACLIVFPLGLWGTLNVAGLANPASAEIAARKIPHGEVASAAQSNSTASAFHLIDANQHSDYALTIPSDVTCTVQDALRAAGVALNNYDRVTPAPGSALTPGATITVTRVSVGYRKRYVTHAPETHYELTTALRPGQKKVKQYQRTGKEELTERVWMKNGKITLIEVTARKTISQVQNKLISVGTSPSLMPGKVPYHKRYARAYNLSARGGSPRDRVPNSGVTLRAVRSMTMHSTAYSASRRENGGWSTTATGLSVVHGVAAVDPRVIPLGTRLYVEGYGFAFASDVGGAIKGNRIDLAMDRSITRQWGRRNVKVWILAP